MEIKFTYFFVWLTFFLLFGVVESRLSVVGILMGVLFSCCLGDNSRGETPTGVHVDIAGSIMETSGTKKKNVKSAS